MGLITSRDLVCDRCGATQHVEQTQWSDLPFIVDVANKQGDYEWHRERGDKILCGECHKGLQELHRKHDSETERFFRMEA